MKQFMDKKKFGLLAAVLGVLLVLLVWLGMGSDTQEEIVVPASTAAATEETESVEETTEAMTQPEAQLAIVECINGEIRTPYLTLYYPDALSDHLTVVNGQSGPYTLEFYALLEGKPEQRMFDICLGEGADGNLGMVETESGNIPVGMTIYTFAPDDSWTEDEINTVLAMQDAANSMIEQLPLVQDAPASESPVISDVSPEANVINYMTIKTPYCTLKYPVVWQEHVHVEQTEKETYNVRFYGRVAGKGEKLLFSIIFGGDEGEQLGVVTNDRDETVTVNLVMEELILPGWSEEDAAEIYAMQEAVNQLIAELPLE